MGTLICDDLYVGVAILHQGSIVVARQCTRKIVEADL